MDTVKVVCGIIFKDNEIFICRRSPHKHLGGYWEFPGGKVEPNEEPEKSLIRELYEELKMNVSVRSYLKTINHQYDNLIVELMAFICDFLPSELVLTDHDDYKWVSVNELTNQSLAPADIPIANGLIQQFSN